MSEVYRVLGEVSLEAGSYEKAIQDITSCLQTQTQCMDADNRFIAETHYQLGNAYLFNRDYTQAVEHLRKAKSVSSNESHTVCTHCIIKSSCNYEHWSTSEPSNSISHAFACFYSLSGCPNYFSKKQ